MRPGDRPNRVAHSTAASHRSSRPACSGDAGAGGSVVNASLTAAPCSPSPPCWRLPPDARVGQRRSDDMRVIGDAERTRFVVDLEKQPEFRRPAARQSLPPRHRPAGRRLRRAGEAGRRARASISDYRYGLIAPGKARIVLDLSGPVEVVNTFVLDPVEPEPARLVIDLVPTHRRGIRDGRARRIGRRARRRSAGDDQRRAGSAAGLPGRRHRSRAWRHRFRRGRRRRAAGEGRDAGVRRWSSRAS